LVPLIFFCVEKMKNPTWIGFLLLVLSTVEGHRHASPDLAEKGIQPFQKVFSKESSFHVESFKSKIYRLKTGVRGGETEAKRQLTKLSQSVQEVPEGKMPVSTSIFNLAKNILGGGMLALPAGMAAGQGTGWVTASLVVLLSGLGSAYTFFLVGKAAGITKSKDFRTLWDRTLGSKTAWIIDAVIIALLAGCSIMYSCFIGDLVSSLAKMTSLPAFLTTRTPAIVATTSAVLVPLCLLRDLSALSSSSLVGLAAVLYSAFFIGLRLVDKTYAPGGIFFKGLEETLKPRFNAGGNALSLGLGTSVLVSMLATAFMAHPNAVKFYNELKDRDTKRFSWVVYPSMCISAVLYVFVMLAGFKTFGVACQGNILNNYHGSADLLATIARVATVISILTTYPLAFAGFRDSFVSILRNMRVPDKKEQEKSFIEKLGDQAAKIDTSKGVWAGVTLFLIGITSLIAIVTTNVGLVISLSGSLLGSGLIFSVPSAMYLKVLKADKTIKRSKFEVMFLYGMIMLGALMAAMGTTITLLDAFTTILK